MNKKPAAAALAIMPQPPPVVMLPQAASFTPVAPHASGVTLPANSVAAGSNKVSTLAAANQLAFGNPNLAAAFQASSAASQFAAGFAAAAALSHAQFQNMLNTLQQQQQPPPAQMPPQTPHNFSMPAVAPK